MMARSFVLENPRPSRNLCVNRGGAWAVCMACRIEAVFLKDVRYAVGRLTTPRIPTYSQRMGVVLRSHCIDEGI